MPEQMNPVGGNDYEAGGANVRTVRGFRALVIAGRRVGTHTMISPNKILYVFLAGAVGGVDHLKCKRIFSAWADHFDLAEGKVYIRTATGLHLSNVHTLSEFFRISPQELWKANQSVLVNPDSIVDIEPDERIKKILFDVTETDWSWEFEQVAIGRTFVSQFLDNFAV